MPDGSSICKLMDGLIMRKLRRKNRAEREQNAQSVALGPNHRRRIGFVVKRSTEGFWTLVLTSLSVLGRVPDAASGSSPKRPRYRERFGLVLQSRFPSEMCAQTRIHSRASG
jgi:hypothetical protein